MVTLKKFFLLIIMSLGVALHLGAQEIKVVSTGQGTTEDEATKTALRSALEDAYGTFISSSTKIENDVLVSDEIVSLTQGNIKEYDVVNSSQLANGLYSVTVESVVSLNELATYCQSKGMSVSFNGKAFGMELKRIEFERRNEIKILKNLAQQIILMPSNLYDFELQATEPQQKQKKESANPIINELLQSREAEQSIESELKKEGEFSDELLQSLIESGQSIESEQKENVISIFVLITPHSTSNMSSVYKLYESTVKSISLTKDERKLYDKLGVPYYEEESLYFRDKEAIELLQRVSFEFRNAAPYYWTLLDNVKGKLLGIYFYDDFDQLDETTAFLRKNPRPIGVKEKRIFTSKGAIDKRINLEYTYTLDEITRLETITIEPNNEIYEALIKPKLLSIIAEFDNIK